ncbi:MAG TPA: hypothetical protein PLB01_10635 [Thermoanaerobaculia bacterium]|nr:hypothetical protein [Thermoanaerobaculia bacterium]
MRPVRSAVVLAAAIAAGAARGEEREAAVRSPLIFASPIHAGCKTYNARTCQIVVEPFTINLAAGKKMVSFQVSVDGSVVYDWRPDQSNPAPALGSTYTPSRVALGFGVTCGKSHVVSLQGRDTGDPNSFNLGQTSPITCPPPVLQLTFYALPPCRLIDTRKSSGPDAGAPVLSGGELRVVGTAQKCGVPPTAAALSMNVTVTAPTTGGFFTLYAADGTFPVASQLSFGAGQTRAGATIVPLALDASGFRILNGAAGTAHLIVDVNGYFE